MTLSKQQFQVIVQVMQKRELEGRINLIDMFDILAPLAKMTKQKLSYFMEERKLIKGQMLFKEGDSVHSIYLLTEGELLVKKKFIELPQNKHPSVEEQRKKEKLVEFLD